MPLLEEYRVQELLQYSFDLITEDKPKEKLYMEQELITLKTLFTREQVLLFKQVEKEFSLLRKDYKTKKKAYVITRRVFYRKAQINVPQSQYSYKGLGGQWLDERRDLDRENGLIHESPKYGVYLQTFKNIPSTKELARAWHIFYCLAKGRKYREIEVKSEWPLDAVKKWMYTLFHMLCAVNLFKIERGGERPHPIFDNKYKYFCDLVEKEIHD